MHSGYKFILTKIYTFVLICCDTVFCMIEHYKIQYNFCSLKAGVTNIKQESCVFYPLYYIIAELNIYLHLYHPPSPVHDLLLGNVSHWNYCGDHFLHHLTNSHALLIVVQCYHHICGYHCYHHYCILLCPLVTCPCGNMSE